jgi:hypothetical protein
MLPKNRPTSSRTLIKALTALVGVLLLFTIGLAGFRIGGGFTPDTDDIINPKTAISIPVNATVAAECETARGKQYIRPQDIPTGPIYDVYQGKVIALEYLVNPDTLAKNDGTYSNLNLPQGSYDHISVIPVAAHAGMNENHFHVITYLIPQKQANMITCNGQPSSDMQMNM